MKLLSSDFWALGISAVIITTFSVLLYADFTKKIEIEGAEQIGTITFKREVAQRRYQAQVVWEEVKQSFPVYDNDSIRTSDNSEAVIHLLDGTDINVDENSMIMLSSAGEGININFAHGSISANRERVTGAAIAAITIRSSDTTVSIDRSNIQLSQLDNMELDLTVSEGSARVKTAVSEDALTVNTNEKAIISSERREAKIVPLSFDLQQPGNNSFIITDANTVPVQFSWSFTGESGAVNFEAAVDRAFRNVVLKKSYGRGEVVTEQFRPGVYYWRVSAFNQSAGKVEFSEVRKINIIYNAPVRLITPAQGGTVSHSLAGNSVIFSWSKNELASNYRVEISGTEDFSSISQTVETPLERIALENIVPGRYFWRVSSFVNAGGIEAVKTTSAGNFTVERTVAAVPPRLMRPAEGEKIDRLLFRGKGALLSWNSDPAYLSYNFEVASDKDFSGIISSGERRVNFAEITGDLPAGRYFWRVRGIPAAGSEGVYSNPASFEVTSDIALDTVYPAQGAEIVLPSAEEIDLNFTWKKVDFDGTYRVQVARNENFSDAVNIDSQDLSSASIKLKDPGVYFWRVQLLDSGQREASVSRTARFSLKEPVKEKLKTFITVNSPVSGGRIFIDSRLRGRNSVTYEVSPDKEVLVTIRAAGFKEHNQRVKVPEGQTITIAPAMEKSELLERVKWSFRGSAPLGGAPVLFGERIVAAYENGTIAVLSSNGRLILSSNLAKRFDSRPVVSGNTAYIVDVDGILYSFDLVKGTLNWKAEAQGPLLFGSEPVVADDRIYFATGLGVVEAFNLNGEKIWENMLDEAVFNSVQIYKNMIIVATDAWKIYALRNRDGRKIWNERIDGRVITGLPLIHKDNLYFGTQAGSFYAMTAEKGKVLWKFAAEGPIYSTPVVIDENIFFGTENGTLYSLSAETGEVKWTYKTRKNIKGSPVFAFSNVFIADENTVYSLNPANGSIRWSASFQSTIRTSPVLAGDTVVLGLSNGEIVSVRNNLIQTVR